MLCTIISAAGVAFMGKITVTGVTIEIIGVVLIVGAMFLNAERNPAQAVADTGGHGTGVGYLPGVPGLDADGRLCDVRIRQCRRAFRRDPGSAPDRAQGDRQRAAGVVRRRRVDDPRGADVGTDLGDDLSAGGMAWVIESQLDTWLGKTLLALVAVAMFSATLAIQASASRVMFSMARDNRLPFGKFLSKVNKRTGTPVITGIAVSTLAILVLLVNIGQSSVFAAIASVSVVIVYIAYLMVTVPALVHRLRGTSLSYGPPVMDLGKWGIPVNLIAVVMGGLLVVNIGWPRAEVYDVAGAGVVHAVLRGDLRGGAP